MKAIKIDTLEKTNKSALVHAVSTVLFAIVYSYIIMFLTDGEDFVGKDTTQKVINGIRHDVVLVICGAFSGMIPITLLKYSKIKYIPLCVVLSIIYYLMILFFYLLVSNPNNVFDLITFATTSIPIGYFIGVIIAIIINTIENRKQ